MIVPSNLRCYSFLILLITARFDEHYCIINHNLQHKSHFKSSDALVQARQRVVMCGTLYSYHSHFGELVWRHYHQVFIGNWILWQLLLVWTKNPVVKVVVECLLYHITAIFDESGALSLHQNFI